MLLAATGVGAGDLATAAFAGERLGVAVLWAVFLGAAFKFVLTEGIARYQLAHGESVLRGALRHFGRIPLALFTLCYVVPFGWFVGRALVTAAGVAGQALLPLPFTNERSLAVHGTIHALLGLILARWASFRTFERLMSACVLMMFLTVLTLAASLVPSAGDLFAGTFFPDPRHFRGAALPWVVGLVGGVGGTLTILCYGDWIAEHGRSDLADLRTCRLDLLAGYAVTALFGAAMVVIGAALGGEGRGTALLENIAGRCAAELGPTAASLFRLGAWAAIFSSLLGVWQAVPRLFAELCGALRANADAAPSPLARTVYQLGIALGPLVPLWWGVTPEFRGAQRAYAVAGACFLPLLAAALLVQNRRRHGRVGGNGPLGLIGLAATLVFFAGAAISGLLGASG